MILGHSIGQRFLSFFRRSIRHFRKHPRVGAEDTINFADLLHSKKSSSGRLTGAHRVGIKEYSCFEDYFRFFSNFADFKRNTTNMFTLTTLSHKTSDSRQPFVMLVNREGQRYFFGKFPEGSQRILNENRIRLSKLKGLFLTGVCSSWSEVGGIPGLFLTLSDSTKKDVDLFCSSRKLLSYVVSTWRYFVYRKGVELKIHDIGDSKIIADSNIIIEPINVSPSHTEKFTSTIDTSDTVFRRIQKILYSMFPKEKGDVGEYVGGVVSRSEPAENAFQTHVKMPRPSDFAPVQSQPSANYLIRFLPIRGKFDPNRAKELGIKPGVDFRKLTQGESVYNDQGEKIEPQQVIAESKRFPKVLILDIPNSAYLHETIQCEKWFIEDENADSEEIGLVYHFLGDDVDCTLDEYIKFVRKFPQNCRHIFSHPKFSNDELVFKTSAINLLKLKCLQNENFNLPSFGKANKNNMGITEGCYSLKHSQRANVETSGVSIEDVSDTNSWSSYFDDNIPQLGLSGIDKDRILNGNLVSLRPIIGSLKDQVQVITLGTGSALPSIYRNVVSTLLRIPYLNCGEVKFRAVLFDGGENTLGSLMRGFGHNNYEQANQLFKELRLINLSHMHADHHLGLISIITKWMEINTQGEVLYLLAPRQYHAFIREWYRLECEGNLEVDMSRLVFLDSEDFVQDPQPSFKQIELAEFEKIFEGKEKGKYPQREISRLKNHNTIETFSLSLGIDNIQLVRAIHCNCSYSSTIVFHLGGAEKFTVSYSGDTRPNPRFADSGYGSDLLIHESTLDHELIEEAIAKKHSTVVEAIAVSSLMNCTNLVLTHFSTRYSDKADIVVDKNEYIRISNLLKEYLFEYGSVPNIFTHKPNNNGPADFSDINICYAFDMLMIRLKGFQLQSYKNTEIMRRFRLENDEEDEIKKEKETIKIREKRENRRTQRLASINKKKRRVDEEVND